MAPAEMYELAEVLKRRNEIARKGNWYYVEKIIGAMLGLGVVAGIYLGVLWLVWKLWNFVVPGLFHAGAVDNYWMFVGGAVLLSVIGGLIRGATSKA